MARHEDLKTTFVMAYISVMASDGLIRPEGQI
jgi:hypothetical protein